jgi:hypothetical protein
MELGPGHDLRRISDGSRPARALEPCVRSFEEGRAAWCGAGNLSDARWAPDSKSLVYRAADGVLWVADVSVPGERAEVRQLSASATCSNGCVISHAYQPGP